MSALKGQDLILYTYENLQPIACEESFTLNVTSTEIITTTVGSGRSINREYGAYDWNIQASGVMFDINLAVGSSKIPSVYFTDNLIKGKKVLVMAAIGLDYYFGIGIITNSSITASGEDFATFDITISADGELYSSNNLQTSEKEPKILQYDGVNNITTFTSSDLFNANVLYIVENSLGYYTIIPNTNYTFNPNIGGGQGRVTFMAPVFTSILRIIYFSA